MTGAPKRLYRSNDQRMVLGVCGGIAEYFGIDPTIVRIVLVVGSILTGFITGIIIYAILAIIMPAEDNVDMHPTDAARSTIDEAVSGAKQAAGSASDWVNKQIRRNASDIDDTAPPGTAEDFPDQAAETGSAVVAEETDDYSENPVASDNEEFEAAVSETVAESSLDSQDIEPEDDGSPEKDQSSSL